MDLRRKRIVYLIVEQVAALLAHGNELAYRVIFFFKAYCRHKFLPLLNRNPKSSRAFKGTSSLAETRAGWRAGANHGEVSPKRSLAFLIDNLCAACPPLARRWPRALPVFRTMGARPLP